MQPTEAFDLDGTLAIQPLGIWRGPHYIGAPIPAMVEQIKAFHKAGVPVIVFTARVCHGDPDGCTPFIQKWCADNLGFVPRITAEKTHDITRFWDDKAVQVIHNTGELAAPDLANMEAPEDRKSLTLRREL